MRRPRRAGATPPPTLDPRVSCQHDGTSHQVFMNGPSYRPNKRPGSGPGHVIPTATTTTGQDPEHGPGPGELPDRDRGDKAPISSLISPLAGTLNARSSRASWTVASTRMRCQLSSRNLSRASSRHTFVDEH